MEEGVLMHGSASISSARYNVLREMLDRGFCKTPEERFSEDYILAVLRINSRVKKSDAATFEIGRTISPPDRMSARGCDELMPVFTGSASDSQRMEEMLISYFKRNWPLKCTNTARASLGPVVNDRLHYVYAAIMKR